MANLKDYISGLIASVTEARYYADSQSAAIARQDRNDNVLSSFSIPRMRIGDIDIDFPYAIDYLNSSGDSVVPNEEKTFEALRKTLCSAFGVEEIPDTDANLQATTTNDIRKFAKDTVKGVNENGMAFLDDKCHENLKKKLTKWCGNMEKLGLRMNISTDELDKNAWNALQESMINKQSTDLEVIAEATKLAECDPRTITHMKFKILEEGMVWVKDSNGDKLIIE